MAVKLLNSYAKFLRSIGCLYRRTGDKLVTDAVTYFFDKDYGTISYVFTRHPVCSFTVHAGTIKALLKHLLKSSEVVNRLIAITRLSRGLRLGCPSGIASGNDLITTIF
jgi:hypothetical protein